MDSFELCQCKKTRCRPTHVWREDELCTAGLFVTGFSVYFPTLLFLTVTSFSMSTNEFSVEILLKPDFSHLTLIKLKASDAKM